MRSHPTTNIRLLSGQEEVQACAAMMAASDPWITLGMEYNECLLAFEGPSKECYALQTGEAIAGFVILQMSGSFKGYIQTLCISSRHRGQGYGTRLLQFCEERISAVSPNMFICISSFNSGALKLYKDFGFKPVGELENFVKQGYTEILLRKTKGPINGYHLQ